MKKKANFPWKSIPKSLFYIPKIEINNKKQEAIKLLYKDNDTLFISIHSLHKISKYNGKDGTNPKINKLGSGQWQKTKNKAKESVKKVAYDLIKPSTGV